ncbi:MAG: HEAT repeat domain-containing protein [Planctomycetes bacterium]|nr:HEAT repeat domain-containing protein [Planctomycetota bacterium]
MRRTSLPIICAALLLGLLAGCSGTRSSSADENGEHAYIDDATLESFDDSLRELALAIQRADKDGETAMRAKLSENARMYQRALLSALHDDGSTPRRAVAGVMLGFTGDASVIPLLMEKVLDPEEAASVRLNSMLGLSTMGDKLRDYSDHKALMDALSRNMEDQEAGYAMRRAAIYTFAVAFDGVQKDSILPLRNRFLSDPDPRVQIAAVNAMGDIGDVAAVNDLSVVGLSHPDAELRGASAIALGKIADPQRVIPALERAVKDEYPAVRRHAIDALSRHYGSDPERVYTAVLTGLSDFDEHVRESSALALARIRDERAIEPLLQATGDRTAVVREAAATALGLLITAEREKEAYPLVELLTDQSPGVQLSAMASLVRICRIDNGSDQPRWRKYFYTKYPDLDPANMYVGKPKPRFSSGISNSGSRPRTTPSSSRTQPRTQPRTNNNTGRNQGRSDNRTQPRGR